MQVHGDADAPHRYLQTKQILTVSSMPSISTAVTTSLTAQTVNCIVRLPQDTTLPPLSSWPVQLAMTSQHTRSVVLGEANKLKPSEVARVRIQVLQVRPPSLQTGKQNR